MKTGQLQQIERYGWQCGHRPRRSSQIELLCTPLERFSVVPGAGSRRAPECQIDTNDSLPPNRLQGPGSAAFPTRGSGSGESPLA